MLNLPDPMFDPDAVRSRVENLWFQVLTAHGTGDPEPLKVYFAPALYRRLEEALERSRAREARYAPLRPAVLGCEILSGGVAGGEQRLVCGLFTRVVPALREEGVRLSSGGGTEVFARERWTLTRPADAVTPPPSRAVSLHCPGCGAPLKLYKSAKCPFCGALVRVPDFDWTVRSIEGAENTLGF